MHDWTLPPKDGSKWWEPGHPWLHESTGNNAMAWLGSVEQLTTAARKVRDETKAHLDDGTELVPAINSVAAMLTGYAIECALKGLWVRAGRKIIEGGEFVGIPNAGDHKLAQIARTVSAVVHLPLTGEELAVLKRLSAFVEFAGRYPVPKRAESMAMTEGFDGGKQVPHVFTPADFQVADRLLNAFTTALNPHFNMFRLARDAKC